MSSPYVERPTNSPDLRLIITGAGGFVGGALLRALIRRDKVSFKAKILVRSAGFSLDERLRSRVEVVSGQLPHVPPQLSFAEPYVVIHFATKQIDSDNLGFVVNSEGTRALLETLGENALGFIYGSSMSVYGKGEQAGISEFTPQNPATPLAKSRKECEDLIAAAMRKRSGNAYLLRPRFVIGVGDRFTTGAFFKLYKRNILLGSGEQSFSFIDVDDYAEVILRLCETIYADARLRRAKIEALNIGYQNPLTYRSIMQVFAEAASAVPVGGRRRRIPHWVIRLLQKWPFYRMGAFATQLELVGFSHYGDVKALGALLKASPLLARDPKQVLKDSIEHNIVAKGSL